ncbi:MAG TPA: hypothetical protein VFN75_05620, partial [Pseudonocardiaceae bacterium]|nr:hypothetical protein [Pseudonocardiaceae bacterium]
DLDDAGAEPNHSLGPVEAQLLRRLNLVLPRDLPWELYGLTVREQVVDVLARRSGGAGRVTLPPEQLPWVTGQAQRMVAALAQANYQVVGDLNDLLPTAVAPGPDPDAVSDAELLDLALTAAGDLVQRYGQRITPPQRSSLRRVRGRGLRPAWSSPRWQGATRSTP